MRHDTVMPLLGSFRYIRAGEKDVNDLQESIRIMAEQEVFPSERQRCLDFMKSANLYERVEKTGKGYIEDVFRLIQEDGNYRRKEIFIMLLPGSAGNEYLYCMKPYVDKLSDAEASAGTEAGGDASAMYANIWRNLLWSSNIKFFWKDRERRFLGASQSFLDFYGFASLDEIIGKNDEDMHWHVDDEPYMNDELDVINKGVRLIDMPGKCIAKGAVHNILANKIPMYDGDDIVGLIGYFDVSEEKLARIKGIEHAARTDSVTGLMNGHAFVDSIIDYAGRYNERGEDYGLIVLNNTRHHRITETYGEEFADRVLKVIAETLLTVAGQTCAVSRQKDSVFAVISNIGSREEIHELGDKIKTALKGITTVGGNSVTMRIKLAAMARSEAKTSDEGMYEWGLKEVTKG